MRPIVKIRWPSVSTVMRRAGLCSTKELRRLAWSGTVRQKRAKWRGSEARSRPSVPPSWCRHCLPHGRRRIAHAESSPPAQRRSRRAAEDRRRGRWRGPWGRRYRRAGGCRPATSSRTDIASPRCASPPTYWLNTNIDWLSSGFTSHSTQNRSFWRRSSQPISWLGNEETKPDTAKATSRSRHSHKCNDARR